MDLLFDTPWWLPTLLFGVGIVLFWNGNRRQETKLRNIGLLVVAGAAVVLAVSYFVDTPLEKAVKQTKLLVKSVEANDWATMRSVLGANTQLSVLNGPAVYVSRDEIIEGAKRAVERYGVKNIRHLYTTAERNDTLITITMTLLSDHEQIGGRTINTVWQFEWQETGQDWDLARIICQKIGNLQGDDAARQMPQVGR